MKRSGLLLFAASLTFAQAASAQAAASAQSMKSACMGQIAAENNSKYATVPQLKEGEACVGYVRGAKDEMDGELAWGDDNHTKLIVGNWQDGVTTDQAIRVFVKYANDNPALLNKPANTVFRQSVEAAGLYSYTPVAIGNTQTAQ